MTSPSFIMSDQRPVRFFRFPGEQLVVAYRSPKLARVVCRHDRAPVALRSVSSLLVCRISQPKRPTPIGTCSQYRLV